MKLTTWNCRIGGFKRKSACIAKLAPDVLAVQEVEAFDDTSAFAGGFNPVYRERSAAEAFPRRGFGMFSFGDVTLTRVDQEQFFSGIRCFEASWQGRRFNIVGVWPWATKSAKTSYRQAHDGLERCRDWVGSRDTVVLGDFNASAKYTGRRDRENWRELLELTKSLSLESAYHSYFNAESGNEAHPTHFHGGKPTSAFHLDYCFIPQSWIPKIRSVSVGEYADWHTVSDHMPLTVDLDL